MTQSGYDAELPESGGKFINLKEKGDIALFRIASEPETQMKHWVVSSEGKNTPVNCSKPTKRMQEENKEAGKSPLPNDCPYCGDKVPVEEKIEQSFQSAWIVLDEVDGKAKIFKTTSRTVFGKIKKLANDPEWGDPTNYKLKITRTEEPGAGYYDVSPSPKDMRPLSDEEKALVKQANFDLVKEVRDENSKKGGKPSGAPELETVPSSEAKPAQKTKTEKVNPDDIPF